MIENNFTRKLINAVKEKKLLLFCLIYIMLPVSLLAPIAHNISFTESISSILLNIAILIIAFISIQFLSNKSAKTCCFILLAFTILPSAIFLGYLLFAQVFLLPDSIISIFETNPEESKEFIAYYMSPFITIGILLYASIPVLMILRMKSHKVFSIKKNKLVFIICIALLIFAVPFRSISKSIYYVNFYKTYLLYKIRHYDEKKMVENRLKQPYQVSSLLPKAESQTVVVVIGESQTRRHMSLYGYGRKTNVLLKKSDSLTVYQDVVSPQVHTIPVIRTVMTFKEKEHPNYFYEKPSLFELFNRAGYETYFITNQSFGGMYETSYDLLLAQAKHIDNPSVKKKPDEVVLPYLQRILNTKSKKNRLIVLHLMGNHMAYMFRYPQQYDVFSNNSDHFITSKAKYMTPEAIKSIDTYDNSIRYNDYVVSQIIKLVKTKEENSAVVYFSDHGEEVFENRNFAGHAYEKISSYMCEIPFIVWRSSTFGNYRKDLVFSPQRPFSTSDFLHSITDLAGLRYKDFDATKSFFNISFQERERYIGEYTYDQVKEMTTNPEHWKR